MLDFFNRDRPGRASLALDLMEELRPRMADRFVVTLINNRMMKAEYFDKRESGAVLLTDDGRRVVLKKLAGKEKGHAETSLSAGKAPVGNGSLSPGAPSRAALARDLDAYPPFLWK